MKAVLAIAALMGLTVATSGCDPAVAPTQSSPSATVGTGDTGGPKPVVPHAGGNADQEPQKSAGSSADAGEKPAATDNK
jgi:hypothetical protein